MFQVRLQYSSILPNYIIETPTTPLCEVIGLFSSDDLQVTFSRVSISVLRENLKEKSGRLLCSCSSNYRLILCFLIGSGRTVVSSFYIDTSQYLIIENFTMPGVLFLEGGTDLGQKITYLTFFFNN